MAKKLIEVDSLKHAEAKRRNIPTAEFESVMRAEDKSPVRLAYERRNRDLDPQLVWRGKDRQDWSDLIVQTPPLYIQEKVHPKAIIDDLVRRTKAKRAETSRRAPTSSPISTGLTRPRSRDGILSARPALVEPHDSAATRCRSWRVSPSARRLRGKVQCIYFDPPYGIKFNSNWQVSTTIARREGRRARSMSRASRNRCKRLSRHMEATASIPI